MRYVLWIVVTVLVFIILWNPWDRKVEDAGLWTPELGNMKADLLLDGIRYQRNTHGRTRWIINAHRGRMFESEQKMLFDRPDIRFMNDENKERVRISADSGDYSMSREIIRLYGDVFVVTDDNSSLSSEFLRFRQRQMLLNTDKDVHIRKRDGLSIDGKGLLYDINRGRLIIYQVKATVPDDDTLSY